MLKSCESWSEEAWAGAVSGSFEGAGKELQDATFCGVQLGFADAAAVCLYYTKKNPKPQENALTIWVLLHQLVPRAPQPAIAVCRAGLGPRVLSWDGL